MDQTPTSKRPAGTLLRESDPDPVEIVNGAGTADILLVCEHAGRAVPGGLARLGLDDGAFERHIAYDIGAEGLSRALSAELDAPLVLQRYSRLVVDCNRPPSAPDFIPEASDGTLVPGNASLSEDGRAQRLAEIHAPFHEAVARLLSERPPAALVAVHSFTPKLEVMGVQRPWHAGFLFHRDDRLSRGLLGALLAQSPGTVAALNQPYCVTDEGDYTIPVHGEARRLPHTLVEIRNDLIATPEGQAAWARRLASALTAALPALPES
ncbi:N-formylglutamate amidohydrolase [Rubellimicrobium arenae]|uniref:N-formylglutamate amidohydrolase n=1 Tax=Rubellimicrobium arenae TaxID=2817372 RepID=UPI001B309CE5|nr:N-formylglutamate amidohydrolase [Rubellimicrobium arenae]